MPWTLTVEASANWLQDRPLLRPVKDVIILKSLGPKHAPEKLAKERVIGLIVEAQRSSVVNIGGKFVRDDISAKIFPSHTQLLRFKQLV